MILMKDSMCKTDNRWTRKVIVANPKVLEKESLLAEDQVEKLNCSICQSMTKFTVISDLSEEYWETFLSCIGLVMDDD